MINFGKTHKRTVSAGRQGYRHWLLLLAVVFQVSVPLTQGLSAPVIAGNGVPVSMICGFTGGVTQIPNSTFVQIMGEDQGEDQGKDQDGQKSPCPFCHSCCFVRAFNLDYVRAELSIQFFTDVEKWAYSDFAGSLFPAEATGPSFRPRAPPSFT